MGISYADLRARVRALEAENETLRRLAHHDELTGLVNRRVAMETLHAACAHAQRQASALSVCMVDVDHFKAVNDVHGHPEGDVVLRRVGELLRKELRAQDTAARVGGEEFLLILPSTSPDQARALVDRLRRVIASTIFPGAAGRITVSMGVASTTKNSGFGLEPSTLISIADKALYAAKNAGRNRVHLAPETQAAS